MKLTQYLDEISGHRSVLTASPTEVRRLLLQRGITPSIGQVQRAMKSRALSINGATAEFHCPMCPDGQATKNTHDQAYHNELKEALQGLKMTLNQKTLTGTTFAASAPTATTP